MDTKAIYGAMFVICFIATLRTMANDIQGIRGATLLNEALGAFLATSSAYWAYKLIGGE